MDIDKQIITTKTGVEIQVPEKVHKIILDIKSEVEEHYDNHTHRVGSARGWRYNMKTRHCTFRLGEGDWLCVVKEIERVKWDGTISDIMRDYLSRLAVELRAAKTKGRKIEILTGR